jgi:hypothetical protein
MTRVEKVLGVRVRRIRKGRRQLDLFVPVIAGEAGIVGWRVDPDRNTVVRTEDGRAFIAKGEDVAKALPLEALEPNPKRRGS